MTDAPTTAVLWSPVAARLPALVNLARKREAEIVATFAPTGPGAEKAEWRELMGLVCDGTVQMVLAASVSNLRGDIKTVITLADIGVVTLTVDEPFLAGGSDVVATLRWIESRAASRCQDARRVGAARGIAAGRRPGRPRVTIPVEAIRAVQSGARLAQTARAYSISETSLRRALQAVETLGFQAQGAGGDGRGTGEGLPQWLRSTPTHTLSKGSDSSVR